MKITKTTNKLKWILELHIKLKEHKKFYMAKIKIWSSELILSQFF